jgi:N,N'-diacetyllegionaminate synthase
MKFAEEIVVSTGATSWEEIEETAHFIQSRLQTGQSATFLHARTIYPTLPRQVGLARMIALQDLKFPIGLSDHTSPATTGLLATKFALLLGATCIERHFTVLEKMKTRDGVVSVNGIEASEISQFARMSRFDQVESLRGEFSHLSDFFEIDSLEPTETEILNRSYYRGRVASIINGKTVYGWEHAEQQ